MGNNYFLKNGGQQAAAAVILVVTAYALGYFSHQTYFIPQISIGDTKLTETSLDLINNCSQNAADLLLHNDFSDSQCATGVDSGTVRQTIIDRVYNGVSPWDNFPPAHLKGILEPESIAMAGSNNAVFEHLITQVRPKTIIEVGTYLGNSAIHMANLIAKLGLNTQIICVDDFRAWLTSGFIGTTKSQQIMNGDRLHLYKFMLNVFNVNLTDSIMFLPFTTSNGLQILCEMGIYGDLVEIDAAHDFHSAWLDINNGYKVLRPGGVLFGHDISIDGVKKAVNLFARIRGFQIKIDGEHWILY